jgi:hypothetical protein
MGPHSSTGSPITFMIRPRVPRPTGTCTDAHSKHAQYGAAKVSIH